MIRLVVLTFFIFALFLYLTVHAFLFSLNGYPLTPQFWLPSNKFTAENLEAVNLGDTKDSVKHLLGEPTSEEASGTFVYSRAHFFPPACPKAWLHFDGDGRVKEVYLKSKIWCFDDSSPYGLSSNGRWKQSEQLAYFFK
jgi:hypothetical protein